MKSRDAIASAVSIKIASENGKASPKQLSDIISPFNGIYKNHSHVSSTSRLSPRPNPLHIASTRCPKRSRPAER